MDTMPLNGISSTQNVSTASPLCKQDHMSRGLVMVVIQGVVTLVRTVEPSATGIKISDQRNFTLIS